VTTASEYVLGLADDALISAQRLGWWISRAPEIEEDVALANIGLDQLGQARLLLAHAGTLEGAGRSEDDLAYLRDASQFRNVWLVERRQTDFGIMIAGCCSSPPGRASSTPPSATVVTRCCPAWPARRSRRSPTTSTTRDTG